MIAPLVAMILGLAIYPTVLTSVDAFFGDDALEPGRHAFGVQNFTAVFSNPTVRSSMVNTAWYVLFGVVLTVVFGTAIGLLLQRPFKARGIIVAIVILPWALPGLVEGIIWSWIYDPTYGVLNHVLTMLGLLHHYSVFVGLNHIETIFLISLVQVWQVTPLAALLVLASLQTIPGDLYEAAKVDGAGYWRTLKGVTLPLIRPGLAVATVEAIVASLNIFDQVYVLNSNATLGNSLMGQAYQLSFVDYNFGQGYALSLVALVITVVMSIGAMKLIFRKVDY
jgi:multiple sugar transport system permease protein